ncbi:MAG: uroporphyrinogen decarboxylase [Armatimonadetes bacterium]|nr:uroporphyrinogen decarboxylase [Armatimonadota bacterium]
MSVDRFLRACRREPVDRTPVWFMRQAGRSLPEYRALRERHTLLEVVAQPDLCAEVTLLPVSRLGVDAAILFGDITLPLPGMGIAFDLQENVGPVIHHPIRTAADAAALRLFEPEEHIAPLLEAVRIVRRESPVPLIGLAGAPFTLAGYAVEGRPSRDFLHAKGMMHGAPEVWAALMDRLADATIRYVQAQAAAGCQAVQIFDSWVGCLSPMDYRDHVQPHMARIVAAVRPLRIPIIHFGTGNPALLPLMAEAGGDVMGVDWRVRLDDAWAVVGGGVAIQGNLDPAAALAPFEVVARRAREVLDQAGGRPGHIFNLGHGVLPNTPVDNLRRLVDFVHEQRTREACSDTPGTNGSQRAG